MRKHTSGALCVGTLLFLFLFLLWMAPDECDEFNQICVNTLGSCDCDCGPGFQQHGPIERITNPGNFMIAGIPMGVVDMDHENHHWMAILTAAARHSAAPRNLVK